MTNFIDAIKTDKGLQQKVADAVKKVAESNGYTIDEKAYASSASAKESCVSVAFSVVCTA